MKPMPAPIDKIQNKYRWRIILKGTVDESANRILSICLKNVYNLNSNVRVSIDTNPNNML